MNHDKKRIKEREQYWRDASEKEQNPFRRQTYLLLASECQACAELIKGTDKKIRNLAKAQKLANELNMRGVTKLDLMKLTGRNKRSAEQWLNGEALPRFELDKICARYGINKGEL